eukprot:4143331-Amphidinium_carterae.1
MNVAVHVGSGRGENAIALPVCSGSGRNEAPALRVQACQTVSVCRSSKNRMLFCLVRGSDLQDPVESV